MVLVWVYYFRNYVLIKSRAKLNLLSAKDDPVNSSDGISISLNSTNSSANSPSSVPWMEILNKPCFWSLIVAHVCQNNAYYILLTWLPTYFQENYPGSKVTSLKLFFFIIKSVKPFLQKFKGWIFNVVPWLISMPSTIFAGWLADKLIAKSKFFLLLH